MKAWTYQTEWWPVRGLVFEPDKAYTEVEITEDFAKEYERIMREFNEMQNKIGDLT